MSLGKIRLRQIEGMTSPAANKLRKLFGDTYRLLITILVGNTLVNIAASALLAGIFYKVFGEKGVGFSIVAMTLILLIFGEVTPKMFALNHAERFSFFSAYPLIVLEKLFAPLRIVLHNISQVIVKSAGIKISPEKPKITEQEIRSLFSIGVKGGVVKEQEKEMVYSILEFKDLNAADIMTPRIDIKAIDLNLGKQEMIREIKDAQYSRLPCYAHSLDNIVGVIHAKDYLLSPSEELKDIVKKTLYVPESMKIDDLLNQLQKEHIHMAIVTDEYGVTSGIVTIEDVLEEIVGEIRDELDLETPKIKKIDQKTWEIDGLTHINEVNEELDLAIDTEEVDTIGGYIILQMGRIPQAGDRIRVNGYVAIVEDVSSNRITRLKIERA